MTPEQFAQQLRTSRVFNEGSMLQGNISIELPPYQRTLELSRFRVTQGILSIQATGPVDSISLTNIIVQDDIRIVSSHAIKELTLSNSRVWGNLILRAARVETIIFNDMRVTRSIDCGQDTALALQCFLYFGEKVTVQTHSLRHFIQIMQETHRALHSNPKTLGQDK